MPLRNNIDKLESYHIVVCGGIVPDPLQTLEPVTTPTGPALKNEMMLPAVLDPWAGHALYEAANLARNCRQQGLAGLVADRKRSCSKS